eukprot:COSAG02_NODE_7854_length_2817_cov_1.524650_2_plen_64_part_00
MTVTSPFAMLSSQQRALALQILPCQGQGLSQLELLMANCPMSAPQPCMSKLESRCEGETQHAY